MIVASSPGNGADRTVTVAAPSVSIVIPTFSRPERLRACLDALTRIDCDAPFEVIVVDDGSTAPVAGVVDAFRDRLDLRLTRQSRAGPGPARNRGAAMARAPFLAFIDDDCVAVPTWLSTLLRALQRDPDVLLGGRVVNALDGNPYADASDRVWQYVYEYNRTAAARERFFTTNNMAVATSAFLSHGGFTDAIPSRTAEDKEFCDRWIARGGRLTFVPDAVVHHAHDLTFARFLRQHFGYGRGILAFRLMRRRRNGARLVPEPLRFYTGLVASPLRDGRGGRRWRAVLLIAAAQAATVAGALREALAAPRRRTDPDIPAAV